MMKLFKCLFIFGVLFTLATLGTVCSSADGYDAFYAEATGLGFSISRDYKPIFMWGRNLNPNGQEDIKTLIRKDSIEKKAKEKLENVTTFYDILLYNVHNPSIYCYAYKVISEPKQPGRNWGFMGIGSYGDDFVQDNIKITIDFPKSYEILSYVPINAPDTWTMTMGVGLSSDRPDVSASVSYNHIDLTIISRTSTYDCYYEAEYDFDESKRSDYMKHEVATFGMILFKSSVSPNFVANYDVRYHAINGYEQNCTLAHKTYHAYHAV